MFLCCIITIEQRVSDMPYIGKSMSENAYLAHKKGLFTKSKITAEMLKNAGFQYSVNFFKWLCQENYIYPEERHHTSAAIKLTDFYSLGTLTFVAKYYDLQNLYQLYLGKKTKEEIMSSKNISYIRLLVPAYYFGLKATMPPIQTDCVFVNGKLFWKPDTVITFGKIIKEFKYPPFDWRNKDTETILRKIFLFKKVSWKKNI